MSKRSDRYNDSPTLKRDDDSGKMKATKKPTENAKKSAQEGSGTEGMAMSEDRINHNKERDIMYHRHEIEHAELHAKHMKHFYKDK